MFRDARLKIDRADKHIEEVKTAVLSLHESYVSSIEEDANSGGHSIKYECPDLERRLTEIALMTGDAIHNLRTALDHTWIALVEKLGLPTNKWAKFPFSDSAETLDRTLKNGNIDSASPSLFEKLTVEVKPYRGGNVYLWGLHEADIADKHKLVLPLMDYTGASGIRVEDEHGVVHDVSLIPRLGSMGVIYLDFFPNIKIKEKGHVSLSVFLHEGSLAGSAIPFELQALSHLVLSVVQSLESLPL